MPATREPSIARKLMSLSVLASGTALVTACLAFGFYDRTTFRANLAQRLQTQAQILAANSTSALAFDDPAAADATLNALSGASHILGAVITRPDGSEFASYRRSDEEAVKAEVVGTRNDLELPRFQADRLTLTRRITLEGKHLGNVTLVSDLRELVDRQRDYYEMSFLVLVVSLATALLMSWLSQRKISRSIVDLARLAKAASTANDYSGRAVAAGGAREVTMLAETFNDMLEQIQTRDRSLQQAHDQLEERVRRRTAELDSANRELEAFSYSVSHDLRAPLRHVSGFAQLLEEHSGAHLDDQGHKYVKTITAAAERMARLIDDLLNFSRIGRAPLTSQPVNLGPLLAEVQREVSGHADPGRMIDWLIGPLPEVMGDRALLRQVFVNLLSNAVKYTATRARAVIEVGTMDGAPGESQLFVRDNGVGFDMKYVDKLFGVFQRLHRSSEFEGTGIGLANVKRTIVRHGGRVWASAEVDQGATFYVALPKMGDTA